MTDLIAKLRNALDEDERVARAAVNWSYGAQQWADSGEPDWTHIARHDPARVLRQVAAMRKILDAHSEDSDPCGGEGLSAEWPCPTVLAFAEAYGIEVET